MTAMKPCPFCGGGAVVSADMTRFPQVACDACGACCGQAREEGAEAAIAAWNTRATPEAISASPEVQALIDAAVKAERERAAKKCEDYDDWRGPWGEDRNLSAAIEGALECAAAIRAGE